LRLEGGVFRSADDPVVLMAIVVEEEGVKVVRMMKYIPPLSLSLSLSLVLKTRSPTLYSFSLFGE